MVREKRIKTQRLNNPTSGNWAGWSMMLEPDDSPLRKTAAASMIATMVAVLAIAGMITQTGGDAVGAITLQDQAIYDISTIAYNRCDPETNPFIESPIQRLNCCTGQCFTPCVSSGIQDCLQICKTVCQGTPLYRAGGSA